MQSYPHTYIAQATGAHQGFVEVRAPQLPGVVTAAPPEFDGPGGVWSPETLLCAAVADCFVLTFRAVTRAARFEWASLDCRVEGVLERPERTSLFTRFTTFVRLTVPANADIAKAHDLLERAEQGCLVANSLRAARALEVVIDVERPAESALVA